MRELGEADLHEGEGHEDDAGRLAEDGAEEHAQGDRVGEDGRRVDADDSDLRVDEGEQGQDQEVDRHREVALHALERRGDVVHDALDPGGAGGEVMLAEHVGLVVIRVVELTGTPVEPALECGEANVRAGGQEEREDDARERGVDARVVHAHPQDEADGHVGLNGVHAHAVEAPEREDDRERGRAPGNARRLPIEERDDHDGENVVGDGEGLEEDLGLGRDPVAQERHHAERERDVRRDRRRPPVHGAALVDDEVDEGGNRHAADGGEHGQGSLARTAQLADGELVLELDAHEQEEDRHEEVVHEGLDGDRDHERPDAEREGRLEELVDGTVGIGVRHGDGDEGREDHDRRSDRPV